MATCQACGTDIIGRDRFCRNCGAPISTLVEDLTDTYRFNPADQPSTTGPIDPTNRFYTPPPAAYAGPQNTVQTASLGKKLFQRKFIWLMSFLLLVAFIVTSIGFVIMPSRDRQPAQAEEQDEEDRQSFEEAVQNALGFKYGSFSASDFPDARGIFVNSLMSDDSPAALAKIQAGDLLMELNDQLVRNNSEFWHTAWVK